MYRAAVAFADLQDGNRRYQAGEKFPRDGLIVSEERIRELAGSNNRMGYPLIKSSEGAEIRSDVVLSADEQTPAPTAKAARKPRRKRESDA